MPRMLVRRLSSGESDDQLHADRRGEVEDDVRPPDQRVDQLGVEHRAVHELHPARTGDQLGQPLGRAGGQVVEDDHPVAALGQPAGEPAADEAGATGDEGVHSTSRWAAPTYR